MRNSSGGSNELETHDVGIGAHARRGGGGGGVYRLVGLNARVPATGVNTMPAYQAFEDVPEIAVFVRQLKTSAISDPSRHAEHRKHVDEVFLSVPSNLVLSRVTHRERPPLTAHAGEFTSYPGGHSIQLTLLMGMMPLAVHVLTGNRSAMRVTAFAAAGVWFVAWADTVRTGGHWPIDQLTGLLIASSLLAVVYSASQSPDQHESCVDCAPRLTTR